MRENRARQIVRDIEALSGDTKEYPLAYWEAKMYLEAIEKAERILVDVLKEVKLPPYKDSDLESLLNTLQVRASKALAQWEKEK